MPWTETCAVEQRRAFIDAWLSKQFTFSDLCERFTISRKTGYKWISRFRADGEGALVDRSRAPLHHPNQTPAELVEPILAAKLRFPRWGPLTLRSFLQREHPHITWPATSTFAAILQRHGLVHPRKARARRTPPHSQPLRHVQRVHDVWSGDFKGDFLLGDGRRCYPFTLSDNHSRFLIDCKGLYKPTLEPVRKRLEHAFRRYGLPRAFRTDNGYPFASTGLGGLTGLSVWLLRLGVLPERIAPGRPQQNPRHERMHRTLREATVAPAAANLSAQQRAFNRFRHEFNELRPHQGLPRRQRPGDFFHASSRPFPNTLPEPEYPEHFLVRRVRHNGEIKARGHLVYLSEALRKQLIALEPFDHDLFQVHFAQLPLAVFDARRGAIIRPEKRRTTWQ